MNIKELYKLDLFIDYCTIFNEADSEPHSFKVVHFNYFTLGYAHLKVTGEAFNSSAFIINIADDQPIQWGSNNIPYVISSDNKIVWLGIYKKVYIDPVTLAKIVMESEN